MNRLYLALPLVFVFAVLHSPAYAEKIWVKQQITNNSNSHFAPKRAILNGIEGFLGSIGGCVTHSCSAFSARRSQATCFWGPLGSFRAH